MFSPFRVGVRECVSGTSWFTRNTRACGSLLSSAPSFEIHQHDKSLHVYSQSGQVINGKLFVVFVWLQI